MERLTGVDLSEILLRLPFKALTDVVLASGSIVDGFGNASSDIDIIVLSPSARDLVPSYYNDDICRWIHFRQCSFDEVRDAASAVSGVALQKLGDWEETVHLPLHLADLAHRLRIGVALTSRILSDVDGLEGCRFDDLPRSSAMSMIPVARARWLDATGAARSGQTLQSIYAASIALNFLVDAYAAFHGETNPAEKWRWAKINRLTNDPIALRDRLLTFFRWGWPLHENLIPYQDEMFSLIGDLLYYLTYQIIRRSSPDPRQPASSLDYFEERPDGTVYVSAEGLVTPVQAS